MANTEKPRTQFDPPAQVGTPTHPADRPGQSQASDVRSDAKPAGAADTAKLNESPTKDPKPSQDPLQAQQKQAAAANLNPPVASATQEQGGRKVNETPEQRRSRLQDQAKRRDERNKGV